MVYCKHCGKRCRKATDHCKVCGNEVSPFIKEEEIHPFVQSLHKKSNACKGKIDTGLSAVVIGLILLIIGVIFYYLSFKKNKETNQFELNFACAEFYVFVIGVALGGLSFIFGVLLASIFYRKKRVFLADMDSIREKKTLEVPFVKPVIVTWGHRLKHFFRKVVFKIRRRLRKHQK